MSAQLAAVAGADLLGGQHVGREDGRSQEPLGLAVLEQRPHGVAEGGAATTTHCGGGASAAGAAEAASSKSDKTDPIYDMKPPCGWGG